MNRVVTSSSVLVALSLLQSCGSAGGKPPHRLEGSLSVLMDLGYETSHVDLTVDDVSVRFARKKGEGDDVVFKVTASQSGAPVTPGVAVDLAESTPQGAQRGVASRNVLDDPRRTFPRLQRGRLLFRRPPIPGQYVTGELSVTFDNGTELASGRTVFGDFEANVQ